MVDEEQSAVSELDDFDIEYAGDLEDDADIPDDLPKLDEAPPPDQGDAGAAGVKSFNFTLEATHHGRPHPVHVGPSGLQRPQRMIARHIMVEAALLGYHHRGAIHYTEGSQRWEGIVRHRVAAHGQFPGWADCSAFVSWCGDNALGWKFHLPDVMNGDRWEGGFTGTLAEHGRHVKHLQRTLRGDLVLYGPAPTYQHVAIIVGHRGRGASRIPIVISHGSESGPLLLPFNYRPDHNDIRRYV